MHEASLARALVHAARQTAGPARITRLTIEVGGGHPDSGALAANMAMLFDETESPVFDVRVSEAVAAGTARLVSVGVEDR
ncbi:MAG: hypothetical protein OEX04_17010 [Acidimicrobiia bacterium]|nr:hypothetical protein [Acidimicrobiia bacterium]MDH4309170.1 hypothetical protein [Acidimicrobiia bacterium]